MKSRAGRIGVIPFLAWKNSRRPSDKIVSIDVASGVICWSHAIAKPALSNLLERQRRLYFGTENSIVCLDVVSGKELFSPWCEDWAGLSSAAEEFRQKNVLSAR